MAHRFQRHYTAEEATSLLPEIRRWLDELRLIRQRVDRMDAHLQELLHDFGDQGGGRVDDWLRHLARLAELQSEFRRRELRVRDLDRGMVVFPALRGDHEVFLSWEEGEERVEHWLEIDPGPGGRSAV